LRPVWAIQLRLHLKKQKIIKQNIKQHSLINKVRLFTGSQVYSQVSGDLGDIWRCFWWPKSEVAAETSRWRSGPLCRTLRCTGHPFTGIQTLRQTVAKPSSLPVAFCVSAFSVVPGMEPRTLHTPSKGSTSELLPELQLSVFYLGFPSGAFLEDVPGPQFLF
jgi:hypothetical protein